MRPVNIYNISRVHDEESFNDIYNHEARPDSPKKPKYHEIESLRLLVDELVRQGAEVDDFDGYCFGFVIPRIGKEFDLLKITEDECIGIELKSQSVPDEQILAQLIKNRHYLSHLGRRLHLYCVVTGTMTCHKLGLGEKLLDADMSEIVQKMKNAAAYERDIDSLFRASDYLISPFTTPWKFIRGEYFLTQAQDQLKRSLLAACERGKYLFHITGQPGTGKTLLLYDIAKTLAKNGRTLLLHCAAQNDGQNTINEQVENLEIKRANNISSIDSSTSFLLVDEAHRLTDEEYSIIEKAAGSGMTCILSSDPDQVLTRAEKSRNITARIRQMEGCAEFVLSEKIRMNRQMHTFIQCIQKLGRKPPYSISYDDISVLYADSSAEAQNMLEYYKAQGYTFINYAKPKDAGDPYDIYEESFDAGHVIGMEFDRVVMLMDSSFYYDRDGYLQGIPHPDPDYMYPNLFYQGITRVREKLALIIVSAPELLKGILGIFD